MEVIFLNMSSQFEWDKGIYNRNKYILDGFSKRDDVEKILSVDFLPYNLKSLLRLYIKARVYKKSGDNIISSGFLYSARRINNKIISLSALNMKVVKRVAKRLGFDSSIIINYNPFNIKYFKYFKDNKKYFDAVDNWSENNTFKKYKEELLKNYKYIINNSSLVFTRPERLKNTLEEIAGNKKDNIKIVLNGVDLDYYKSPQKIERIDQIFAGIDEDKIKVGYLGVIKGDRIDSDLLEYIIQDNQDKYFIIAGPVFNGFNLGRFNRFNNVIFPGEMSYSEIPYFYNKLNICIIPHLINDFIKSMDPMKIYGYLAAGKPIISVPIPGVEQFREFINIVNTKEEFSYAIKQISDNKENFAGYKIIERQNAVEGCSWKSRVEQMINLINYDIIK